MRRRRNTVVDSHPALTRRALILGAGQVTLVGLLALQMRQMQIRDADQYRMMAEDNRINLQMIAPARGRILDRNGIVLADNQPTYQITISRERSGDLALVLDRLQTTLPITGAEVAEVLAQSLDSSAFVPITVADRVSWEDLTGVAFNAPALPGVMPETVELRNYPFGPDFAHVIGYVGRVSTSDLEEAETPEPLLTMPGFKIGKPSIERAFHTQLRGQQGTLAVEVNATGRVMRDLYRIDPVPGGDLQLTLDHHLQNFMMARLGDQSAAAVVMDVRNGDILASVSAPSFDPNLFVGGHFVTRLQCFARL